VEITPPATKSFAALNLSAESLSSLDQMGYKAPTDVQFETVPRALGGKDLVVQSRTGTGKTAAFGIPIVEKIDPAGNHVQALVLTPTRELCVQVTEEIARIGSFRNVRSLESLYGPEVVTTLRDGIATTGRWGLPQGQGELITTLYEELTLSIVLQEMLSGYFSSDQSIIEAYNRIVDLIPDYAFPNLTDN
jgi:hypothetical protein